MQALDTPKEILGIGPEALLRYWSDTFHIPAIANHELRDCLPAFDLVPFSEASRRQCLAVRPRNGGLFAVLGDPHDCATQDWLEEGIREPFAYRIAHPSDVEAFLSRHEGDVKAMDGLRVENAQCSDVRAELENVSMDAIEASDSPVIKLVTSTLYDAIKLGASDIHLETVAKGLAIKYRVDGVLGVAKRVDGIDLADQVISRVKVMSQLDIAERRVPQDGRFRARSNDREIDFRVSIMPSVFGEDAVVRILDKRGLSDQLRGLTLDRLGFEPSVVETLRRLSGEPHGMVLVTGPTGSGKTTTLYAAISEINNGSEKIVTIEDPVEYQLADVLQIPVNEKKGLTFARGLRSILRHDPDRIMVGEIRDAETAEIAVQSALTGHLVYTTVHANNVYEVIGRFVHMGADIFNLASALNAVMAQRLLRILCTSCRGGGCADCRGTGYRGRKAIAELMVLSDDIRELIVARAPVRKLKEAARAAGTRSLREAAMELVNRGETSMQEIDRVTFAAG